MEYVQCPEFFTTPAVFISGTTSVDVVPLILILDIVHILLVKVFLKLTFAISFSVFIYIYIYIYVHVCMPQCVSG